MCGIAGIVGTLDDRLERALDTMLSAQKHRGPDDSGLYRNGTSSGVMLGFRRLAILDLTTDGHQPMVDQSSGNTIVFNGEIYNFAEIRAELEASGESFRSTGDTEVLLRAYSVYGSDVVRRLRGMFAFAIHDVRHNCVFLARDRLGIKPLYYAEIGDNSTRTFLFASELRALLATDLVSRRLDPVALAAYLWNGFVIGPNTMVQGVSLLAPGQTMTLDLQGRQIRREQYWSLGPRSARPADVATGELSDALKSSAAQHLVSDVPLGIFLSGGIDSSAVAALAVRSGKSNIKTFHIGFEEAGFDESRYARTVADALHTEHAEYQLTQTVFVSQLQDALNSIDQPTFDAINTYFVSRVVREAGFTVALAGTGGDELFGGYQSFRNVRQAVKGTRALRRLPIGALGRAAQGTIRALVANRDTVAPQTRWGKLSSLMETRGSILDIYQVFYSLFTKEFLSELVNTDTPNSPEFGLPAARRAELENAVSGLTPLAATSALELGLFIGERLLRDSDAASMAVSLELRVPLLDHRVVEAAQRVPDEVRFSPLGKKQLLRTLGMPELDPGIFDRPKAGFVLPIEVWAKDKLAGEIESTFSDRALVESVGLNPDVLNRLWRSFLSGAKGMYWSRIWAPYVLLNWCRSHRISL